MPAMIHVLVPGLSIYHADTPPCFHKPSQPLREVRDGARAADERHLCRWLMNDAPGLKSGADTVDPLRPLNDFAMHTRVKAACRSFSLENDYEVSAMDGAMPSTKIARRRPPEKYDSAVAMTYFIAMRRSMFQFLISRYDMMMHLPFR